MELAGLQKRGEAWVRRRWSTSSPVDNFHTTTPESARKQDSRFMLHLGATCYEPCTKYGLLYFAVSERHNIVKNTIFVVAKYSVIVLVHNCLV
jgi:hypothetical protein